MSGLMMRSVTWGAISTTFQPIQTPRLQQHSQPCSSRTLNQ